MKRPLRGTHLARGVVLTGGDSAKNRLRALKLASAGAELFLLGEHWLVVLAVPRTLESTEALGMLAVEVKDSLLALSPAETSETPSVMYMWAGVPHVVPRASLPPLDMSAWIDTSALVLERARTAPHRAALITVAPKPIVELGKPIAPPPEHQKVIDAIRAGKGHGTPSQKPGVFAWMKMFLKAYRQPAAPAATFLDRVKQAMRSAWDRFLFETQLVSFYQAQNAAYLQRMFRMFEDADFENALRHAVPLSMKPAKPTDKAASPSLLAPRPNLNLSFSPAGGGPSSFAAPDLFDYMKQLYEQAFASLDRRGERERAAYVLLKLLDDPKRAIEYLEKNGKLAEAATLAEEHGSPPVQIVSLWMRAGNVERATFIALMLGAHHYAIAALMEKGHHELADQLRRAAGRRLLDRGQPLEAVDVLWPSVQKNDALVREALAALRGRDNEVVRVLKELELDAKRFEELRDRFAHALDGADATTLAIAEQRLHAAPVRADFAPLVRMWVRQSGRYSAQADAVMAAHLQRVANLPKPALEHALSAPRGEAATAVAVVEGPAYVIAAGLAGLFVWTENGRERLRSLDAAHTLVPAQRGSRCIVVTRREDHTWLSLLDAASGMLKPWLQFDGALLCESSFAGDVLFCASVSRFLQLAVPDLSSLGDTPLPRIDALFSVDLEAPIQSIRRMDALIDVHTDTTLWRYRYPFMKLDSKSPAAAALAGAVDTGGITLRFDGALPVAHKAHGRLLAADTLGRAIVVDATKNRVLFERSVR